MKMMKITDKRFEWHLSLPACETLSGVITHINHLSIPEVMALVQRFDCDSVGDLGRALWTLVKDRKQRRLNAQQVKLVQTAVRAAGLRSKNCDGRYRLLLGQYLQPTGRPVTSCKQLNNAQLDDMLAICEAYGWRMPGKPEDFYRKKVAGKGDSLSTAQTEAIKHLRGDLGWEDRNLSGFIRRMTGGKKDDVCELSVRQAYAVIEGLKAILGRERGQTYSNLNEVKEEMEVATDGTNQT